MTELEAQARKFAWSRHQGQFRKYTKERYVHHSIDVAELVKTVTHTDNMIAAALLHDVVENTSTTLEDIESAFNLEIANLVGWLTKITDEKDGNRKLRQSIEKNHLQFASPEAKTIKLADIIDNCIDIRELDPEFAKTYLAEKADQLEVLQDGDPILFGIAYNIVHNGD
jgi:(p)ppGpp synthase/HD superfamily hydrolase